MSIQQNRTVFRFYQTCQKGKKGGFADGRAAETLSKYTSMRRKQRKREETFKHTSMRRKQGKSAEIDRSVLTKSSEVFQGMFEDRQDTDACISARIKYYLHRAKTSHWKLAKALGCSRDTVFSYANGKISEDRMNVAVLKKMAAYFGTDPYYFCNEYHVFVDTVDVPEYLKGIRKAKGMSQREFCEKVQIPLAAYKKYETGAVRIPGKYYRVVANVGQDRKVEL